VRELEVQTVHSQLLLKSQGLLVYIGLKIGQGYVLITIWPTWFVGSRR